jgi:hypothetical protein
MNNFNEIIFVLKKINMEDGWKLNHWVTEGKSRLGDSEIGRELDNLEFDASSWYRYCDIQLYLVYGSVCSKYHLIVLFLDSWNFG